MDLESASLGNLLLVSFAANLGSFMFGYDFGAASWLISWFENYDGDDSLTYYSIIGDSDNLIGLVGASALFGAVATYFMLLLYGNHISKRDELLIAAVLYFCGALIESLSVYLSWADSTGFTVLIIGRWVYGAGMATSMHSSTLYSVTMSPKELRGTVGATTEVMISLGILSSYIVGYLNSSSTGWTVIFRVGYILAFAMGCVVFFLPHLPVHLARTGHSDEDILSSLRTIFPLASLHDVGHVRESIRVAEKEHQYWMTTNENYEKKKQTIFWTYFYPLLSEELRVFVTDRANRYSFYLINLLVMTMPLSGLVALMYYANTIFSYLGVVKIDACVVGLGCIKVISATLLLFMADALERRVFILFGQMFMMMGLVSLIVGYQYSVTWLAVTGAYIAVFGYEMSLGTFAWILISELFPDFVCSAANSIAVANLLCLNGILNFILPFILNYIGIVSLFSFFVCVTVFQFIVVFLYLPNTRGVPIEMAYKLVVVRVRRANRYYFGCCCSSSSSSSDDDDVDDDHDPSRDMVGDMSNIDEEYLALIAD